MKGAFGRPVDSHRGKSTHSPPFLLATFFGCGYFPWAPGTAGSLAALFIAIALHSWLNAGRLTFAVLIVLLLYPAIWSSTRTARILNTEDPGMVVIDEVLGQWLTLLGAAVLNWKTFLAAFLFFRLFDIWKPWPIRRLENLPEGSGIVTDDLAAGLYGAVVLSISGSLGFY
jgi:phosphatidylglycerophosphatase A